MPDTHNARRNIPTRIRAAQKRPQARAADEWAQVEAYLVRHPAGPQPQVVGDALEHFREQAKRMGRTFEELPDCADVPMAVARFLASLGLPARIAVWPELAGRSFSGPSRTGDIEQAIVLGAHGPYRVHILALGGT